MIEDKFTIQEFYLDVSHHHKIYVQEWGNKNQDVAIINIHGGPGGGTSNSSKGNFTPDNERVIFFDQRGTGNSLPKGKLEHNNTDELVEDIKTIVDKFSLKKAILCGGSWGSTLALAYAIKYPETVKGMVLDGIFTVTKEEDEWFNGGWQTFFPEAWQNFIRDVPVEHIANPVAYYAEKARSKDALEAKKAIYNFISMEASLIKLDPLSPNPDFENFDETSGEIELHYLRHDYFIKNNYILKNASKLKMPITIIQGQYDMVCPPKFAYNLHEILPNSELIWAINGHIKEHESFNVRRQALKQLLKNN
jgi:proline iminopeptidase